MATATLRPNGDGFYDGNWSLTGGTAGSAYTCIDEAVTDDTDYITNNDTSSPYDPQTVTLQDMPEASSAISSVVMHWRSRCAFSTLSTVALIRSGGSDTENGSPTVVNTTDTEYSWDITSLLTWTDTLINGLEIGWRKNATANNTLRVTQAWVVVTYTAAGGSVTVDLAVLPASATATAVAPTVVQGSLTIAPAAASATATAVAPTVIQSSVTVDLAALPATATATAVAPTVVQGSITLDLASVPATATATAIAPTIPGGDETVDLAGDPATATATAVAPTVVLGSITLDLAALPATATSAAVAPTVVLGSVTVAPEAATATASAVAPDVVLGSLTIDLAALVALATATAVAPTVVVAAASTARGVLILTDGRPTWLILRDQAATRLVLRDE